MKTKYTPEIIATIYRLIERGNSYQEAADIMSKQYKTRFTKNMLISKVNRTRKPLIKIKEEVKAARKNMTYEEFSSIMHS